MYWLFAGVHQSYNEEIQDNLCNIHKLINKKATRGVCLIYMQINKLRVVVGV